MTRSTPEEEITNDSIRVEGKYSSKDKPDKASYHGHEVTPAMPSPNHEDRICHGNKREGREQMNPAESAFGTNAVKPERPERNDCLE